MFKRTLIAMTLIALPVTSAFSGLSNYPVNPATLDGPAIEHIGIRAMAEIDGNPHTFTAEEREKMAVLEQVMGTAPLSVTDTFNLIES